MTPSARLQAVVELLDEFQGSHLALDVLAGNYLRKRRYIGSKDRREIKGTLYNVMRDYIRLAWLIENAGAKALPRTLLLAYLSLGESLEEELLAGGKYGLAPLSDEERKYLDKLNAGAIPAWAQLNCPEWLEKGFRQRFGEAFEKELQALNGRAPLTLRINTLKTSVDEAAQLLKGRGFTPTGLSPVGFASPENVPLHDLPGYQEGHFEVQDEGSQVAAQLVGAEAGQQVLDLCAGAGGKTLALAAAMQNKGQIFAYDADEKRLKTLQKRVQKAGARNVQVVAKEALKDLSGKMDRVLLDVPCSGTGTWRRSPDLRLRLTQGKLVQYVKTQQALLQAGAGYVKPGGRLVYVTCSLLPSENEDQISAFLENTEGWQLVDAAQGFENNAAALQLTPARHATDGFFVAALHKTS